MIAAWKLPLIVAAIAVSIVTGFYLGGPGLGMAVGGLAAAALVVMAIRDPPRPPIVPCKAGDGRSRLLLVLADPDDEAAVVAAAPAAKDGAGDAEVLVLAPLRQRFLDRWACDVDRAQQQAQGRLVLALANLAKAGVAAGARLGDENPVQAVEDTVRSYPATRVALVAPPDEAPGTAAAELRARLAVPFVHIGSSGKRRLAGGHLVGQRFLS